MAAICGYAKAEFKYIPWGATAVIPHEYKF